MDILSTSWSAHLLFLVICIVSQCGADYQLTVLHTNDVHSRVEQFNKYGSECDPDEARDGECFGGAARRGTKVREIRESVPNVLLLDGGDQYQGTMWFFIYKGAAVSHFMNMIGYDAMVSSVQSNNHLKGIDQFWKRPPGPLSKNEREALITNHVKEYVLTNT